MPDLPNGPSLVLKDVFGHPGAAITEIAERTALPQSYVSESVARLREQGVVAAAVDPADGRRRLITVTARHARRVARRAEVSVDATLAAALEPADDAMLIEVLDALAIVSRRLRRETPGAILEQLHASERADA